MAGVLRAIAELEHYDERQFKDWIGIVVVADGSDKLPDDFKKQLDEYGLIDYDELKSRSTVRD